MTTIVTADAGMRSSNARFVPTSCKDVTGRAPKLRDSQSSTTEIAVPKSAADFGRPRALVSFALFRAGLIVEYLLRGLIKTEDGALKLPEKGCVGKDEIDGISPLHLCTKIQYPPVYQVMGTEDEGFEISHVIDFDKALKKSGVSCNKVVVPDVGHAFDMWAAAGGDVDEKIIRPAVEWLANCAGIQA